jgi:hypothetical protein
MNKKKYQSEIKNIKKIISNINYGIKTEKGIRPSATKRSLEKNFRKPITNKLIRDHWNNKQTLYFYGNENINEKCLIMIDIDVDKKNKKGSLEGAISFAEHLKSKIQDFYYETSTNGKGVHGYLVVDKCDKNSIESNKIFKKFENFLIEEKEKVNADIELVEIKGTLHEIKYKQNRIAKIKFGTLGKIPKNINEFFKFENKEIKITDIEKNYCVEKAKKSNNGSGSISKKLITKKDLDKLEILEEISKNIFGEETFKKNKFKITHEDIAIALLLLIFFKNNKNEDKTLPTKRVMMLWKALYECGDIDRAWNHHRWKGIRDMLSEKGLIYWIDNNYTYGNKSINQKGIACKWEIRKKLYMYIKTYLKEAKREKRASLMDTKPLESIKILDVRQIKSLILYKIPVLYTVITRAKEFLILNKANEYIKSSFCYT